MSQDYTAGSFYGISWSIIIGIQKLLVLEEVLLFASVFVRKITEVYTNAGRCTKSIWI